jgi:hypothetical protein
MAEDEDRMTKAVQSFDRSLDTSIGKYSQFPSASNGKISEG